MGGRGGGLLALLVASACGRVGFDPGSGGADASALAPDAAGTCSAWSAWSAPHRIDELAAPDVNDGAPWVAADGLEIIYGSSRPGGMGGVDLWRATRASIGAAFEAPTPLAELNSGNDDDNPWLTADGLRIYFSVYDAAGGEVQTATRSSRGAPFGPLASLPLLDDSTYTCCVELLPDGLHGVATMGATVPGHDVVLIDRPDVDAQLRLDAPIPVAATGQFECCATWAPGGETLLYTLVAGVAGNDARLMTTTRVGADFAAPEAFTATLTENDDGADKEFDAYWVPDGTAIWYTRQLGNPNDTDIWVVERACLAP